MDNFTIQSKYSPTGDQPQAIDTLVKSIQDKNKFQTLQGVTGSGKTFTMANIIEKVGKPTLILAHNKTLAAQLCSEFRSFFPHNAVEYFVSYYDYYQPEAYVPGMDLYIEKDSSINDDIDQLRHSATSALATREDVIIVSSVSCIYGLGSPIDYKNMVLYLKEGMEMKLEDAVRKLVDIQYQRSDMDFKRGTFRLRGDTLDIFPAAYNADAIRIEFFGDNVEAVKEFNVLNNKTKTNLKQVSIFPASHYVSSGENIEKVACKIQEELSERVKFFKEHNMLLEAQRIMQRTNYDIELLKETGFCKGIENYTRYIIGKNPGEAPFTLMDYFPKDYLMFIDESHVSVPQVRGMFGGDRSRKQNLVDYGFRLPSAYDNRPLNFDEFEGRLNQVVFVSATPGPYEKEKSAVTAKQMLRPTGLLDPEITVIPSEGQMDHLIGEIHKVMARGEKVLVTTLTKRMAQDLTDYLIEHGVKASYLHSDIETAERMERIRDLRLGKFDVIVGINLLREGLDIPEVSLVAILDADKEGFLRSETSLVQTIGRAARNVNGHVIMYADTITDSMQRAISETNYRRMVQQDYNREHDITPRTIIKDVAGVITNKSTKRTSKLSKKEIKAMGVTEVQNRIDALENEMQEAAKVLDFEKAANLRDEARRLKSLM